MRKKLIIPILTVTLFSAIFSSCGEDSFTFTYDLDEFSFCFAASQFVAGQEFSFVITQSDIQSAFSSAGVSIDDIESATLDSLRLVVTDSAGNLNEIAGLQVYVREVGDTTTNGVQVAYVDNIADNSTEVSFLMTGTALKDWLLKDQFELHIVAFNENEGSDEVCLMLTSGQITVTTASE